MNQDPVSVSRIQWLRVFPVLNLRQAVRMGFRLRVLIPCLVLPWLLILCLQMVSGLQYEADIRKDLTGSLFSLPLPLNVIVASVINVVSGQPGSVATDLSSLVLAAFVVTVLGMAVARATATEFCQQIRTGTVASVRFSIASLPAGLVSLALCVLLTAVPLIVFRLAAAVYTAGLLETWLAGVGFCALLILAILTIAVSVVCGIAWLLSLGAIGTDRCSGSDALSRSISYVLSHKLCTTAICFSAVCISSLAMLLTRVVVSAGFVMVNSGLGVADNAVAALHDFRTTLLIVIPNAVQLGVLLSAATIGYLLLREKEDAIQLRELDGGKPTESM